MAKGVIYAMLHCVKHTTSGQILQHLFSSWLQLIAGWNNFWHFSCPFRIPISLKNGNISITHITIVMCLKHKWLSEGLPVWNAPNRSAEGASSLGYDLDTGPVLPDWDRTGTKGSKLCVPVDPISDSSHDWNASALILIMQENSV